MAVPGANFGGKRVGSNGLNLARIDSKFIYSWSMLCVNLNVGIGLIISQAPLSVSVSVTVEEFADHALLPDYVSLGLLL